MAEFPWGVTGSYPEMYEALAVPAFFRRFAEDLVDRAAPAPGERILDVACGTGVVSRLIAERELGPERLTALDLTPAMLDVARAAPHAEAVEWTQGDAQDLGFEDGSFDLVLSQQGLQFVPDGEAAAREMHRVLGDDGRALVACWAGTDSQPLFSEFVSVLDAHAPDFAAAAQMPFSMTGDRLAGMFEAAGFREVELTEHEDVGTWPSAEQFVRTFRDGTPISLLLGTLEPEAVQGISRDAEERVGAHAQPDGSLRGPMRTHIVSARR